MARLHLQSRAEQNMADSCNLQLGGMAELLGCRRGSHKLPWKAEEPRRAAADPRARARAKQTSERLSALPHPVYRKFNPRSLDY